MALPSSSASSKISALPSQPGLNVAAFSTNPALMDDAFDRGLKTAQAVGDSILIRPRQAVAAGAQADDISDQVKTNMVLRPLLERVQAAQAEKDFTQAKNDTTTNRITETAMAHPDYQSAVVDAKITTAQHNAAQAKLDLDKLTATGADVTNEEVLKARKKVRDAQYDLDTLADEQDVLNKKRGVEKKTLVTAGTNADAAQIAADVNLKTAQNPGVQQALVDTNTANVATGRLGAITNLARQVALGTLSPTAITQEDDAKLRQAAQAAGVNVIDPTGRPRLLQDVTKEYAAKVSLKDAEPTLKDLNAAADAAQGSLTALTSVKGLGQVNTGFLYTLPGVTQVDKVLAQLGVDESQKREFYSALNTQLIPLIRGKGIGSQSDVEFNSYKAGIPGPGISEKTNTAMLAGLFGLGQRISQRPAFYTSLLNDGVSIGKVNEIWTDYVNANPTVLDANTANPSAFTPDQYVEAIKNPEAAAKRYAPNDPAAVTALPRGNTAAEIAAAPAWAPYVAVKGPRGAEVAAANPKYWQSVLKAGQAATTTDTVSPQSSAYSDAFRSALSTPTDVLLRAIPTSVPTVGPFTGPIRRK